MLHIFTIFSTFIFKSFLAVEDVPTVCLDSLDLAPKALG